MSKGGGWTATAMRRVSRGYCESEAIGSGGYWGQGARGLSSKSPGIVIEKPGVHKGRIYSALGTLKTELANRL